MVGNTQLAKYIIDKSTDVYTFHGIWLYCAVESRLPHIVHDLFNLQQHIIHTSLSAYKICALYTYLSF